MKIIRWMLIIGALFLAVACSSDDDDDKKTSSVPTTTATQSVDDTGAATANAIWSASVNGAGQLVIKFTLIDSAGAPVTDLVGTQIRFGVAQLHPSVDGNSSYWKSYINTWVEATKSTLPNYGNGAVQATVEVGATGTADAPVAVGTLVDNGKGNYTYTFKQNLKEVTSPIAVTYDETLTHRVSFEYYKSSSVTANGSMDFRPDGRALTTTRNIAVVETCNGCHDKLALHGGRRLEVQNCVICHNPGTIDPESTNTVDMKVMVHKIHRGKRLPSVLAGGKYIIYGYNGSTHDYSTVGYPQDAPKCTQCHNPDLTTTQDSQNWKTMPTAETCGACHDDVDFKLGTNHSGENIPQANNKLCSTCHGPEYITDKHAHKEVEYGKKFKYDILEVTNTAPGQTPSVKFSITDLSTGLAYYDFKTNRAFSSVSFLFGTSNSESPATDGFEDYNKYIAASRSTVVPSATQQQAVSNGDGTYTIPMSTTMPANSVGSGIVAMQGRLNSDVTGDGVADSIPVQNVVKYFAVTDSEAKERRTVVTKEKCKVCHEELNIVHGSTRTDPKVCVVCHNPSLMNTTSNVSTDFKYMIHAIHRGEGRAVGYKVGTDYDYSEVRYPAEPSNCAKCHEGESYKLPLSSAVMGSTIARGASSTSTTDDTKMSPTVSVCLSCHAGEKLSDKTTTVESHVTSTGGGSITITGTTMPTETCSTCHGAGQAKDVATVHTIITE
ncbi:MAG: OmcA/MtrC family decaheme c-type cytochrome [SAR324 cluster bacterium]|nr:OmcA/MtrC family decaheme c-type cytochrome [SAR324 cluster bacterium]